MDLSQTLEFVTKSDVGKVRASNEDAVYANPVCGLAILADGMGGYNAGEVASGMATTLLGHRLEAAFAGLGERRSGGDRRLTQSALEAEIAHANGAVYSAAQSQPQYAGMGTTLVMALFHGDSLTVAHIGDSRLYRLRGRELQLLTRDHSLLQEQLDSGLLSQEQAHHAENRNLVTRALGVDPSVEAEIKDIDTRAGDVYLLCSDGLNDMIDDEEIGAILRRRSSDLEQAAAQLVQRANDSGGRDNVSLILVRIGRSAPAARGWLASLFARFKQSALGGGGRWRN